MILANFSVVFFASIVTVTTFIEYIRNRKKNKVEEYKYDCNIDSSMNPELEGVFGKIIVLDEDA